MYIWAFFPSSFSRHNGATGTKVFDIFGSGRCANIGKRREGNFGLFFFTYIYTSSLSFPFSLFPCHAVLFLQPLLIVCIVWGDGISLFFLFDVFFSLN